MLGNYNRWANTRLYDAAFALPEPDYRKDLGAAFGSIHGTLNHLIVADLIWLNRFTGEGAAPTALDAIVADENDSLLEMRTATDDRISAYIAGLSEAALGKDFSYTSLVKPQPVTQPLAPALLHFFNHHTHHRGQCHAMLTRLCGAAPSLDLIYYQRETGEGIARASS
ncbi:MAG: DinB family protein [Pseudomonadota bacterium]